MFREELVMQVKAAEDHVHLRHVIVVVTMKRVVLNGEVRPRRIQQSQVLETAGAVDVGKETVKKLQVAFAVEDHHWDLVTVARRPDPTDKILRNDVAQQRGFSGSRLTENDALHDANPVRPKPRGAEPIVSKN